MVTRDCHVIISLCTLSTEHFRPSQVESDVTMGVLESNLVSPPVLEENAAYLEIIDDYEDILVNEEPHYHEIRDSEVHGSQVMSAERSPTASSAMKTAYQSLQSATRDVPRTISIPDYAQLRTRQS